MSSFADRSVYYETLAKMYAIAENLSSDSNYHKSDALKDLLKVIKTIETDFWLDENFID